MDDASAKLRVASAAVVLPCVDFDQTLEFFVDQVGFVVESIWPADDPATAEIVGHGLRLRLRRQGSGNVVGSGQPVTLVVRTDDAGLVGSTRTAPDGTTLIFESAHPPLDLPPVDQRLVISRADDGSWGVGRAGMRYRDLIPEREGGRFIASHIHIADGGPVPDYVHHHQIRFQLIFVRSGWVRVVYEDQGDPFVMEAGDAVLQPPHIRHRVLESSPDLEVIEIGCPAEHRTAADLDLELPTGRVDPNRDFGGQRFVRHVAADATWEPSRLPGFEARNTGIDGATVDLADVRVHRPAISGVAGAAAVGEAGLGEGGQLGAHGGEFQFFFVLRGSLMLLLGDRTEELGAGDSVTIPADVPFALAASSDDLELLDVNLPHPVAL